VIVRGGTVVTARGVEVADVAIEDGLVAEVGRNLSGGGEEIDATGLHIFPGGIDSHVHFNEPGRTEWEDIAHGTAALLAGGYTAFVDMPLNNLPVTTTVEAFDMKLAAMARSAKVDYGLWGGLVPGNLDQLEPLVKRGVMGFKAFMCPSGIDEFPAADERTLRAGMKRIADLDSILLVHAEDPAGLREPRGPSAADFIESRPVEAETSAIRNAIEWATEARCRLHIVHVSSLAGAELIVRSTHDVSGETCPHYMLYWDKDMSRIGGTAKCAPPLRAERMRLMPIVVSDHSPSTLDLKQGDDFRKIWGGISGCQSTRQLLLAHNLLHTVAAVTSTNIATRFRIEGKGDLAPGYDADLWLVDLSHKDVVRSEELLYKNQFSAHEGQKIRGRTVRTIHGSPRLIRPGVHS
jgi:allantoinase